MSGAPHDNLAEAQRWLKQAEENLATARWNGQGKLWAAACFYSQQTGEIALKAVLIRQGERSLFTHSVLRLTQWVGGYHPEFSRMLGKARRLDRYYIATRYPNGMDSGTASENFDEQDYREAEPAAAEFVELARAAIAAGSTATPP